MSRVPTKAKADAQSVEDSAHVEGSQCPAKSSSVKLVTSVDTLPDFVSRKKTSSFQIKEAKGTPVTSRQGICQR